jgi:hypothetical protein
MDGFDGGRLSSALRLITAMRGQGRTPRGLRRGLGTVSTVGCYWTTPNHGINSRFRLRLLSGTSFPFRSMAYDFLAADDKHMRRSYASGYTMRSGIRNLD